MEFPYTVIVDPQEVGAVASALERVDKFAFDLETTSLDFNRGVIHGVSVATEDHAWYFCLGAEKAFLPMFSDLSKSRLVIGHNLLFDLHFTAKYGIRPPRIADTMIGQYLFNENQSVGLKKLAGSKLGIREPLPDFKELLHMGKKLLKKRLLSEITIYDVPLDQLAEYAARDARLTYDLWKQTEFELDEEGMTDMFWNLEMPFIYVLLDMEASGFYIDQHLLNQLGEEYTNRRQSAYDRWMNMSNGVNPNSPAKLEEYLFLSKRYPTRNAMKTKGSKGSANEHFSTDVFALYRQLVNDKNGELEALLEFRKYDKLIGTYINPFAEQLWSGRLYGNFNRTGTVTGRLSSSAPNLQNIPARGELGVQIRQLFSSEEGNQFVSIDQSQFELRVLAHYSKDERMMKVFEENSDPHQMTADLITNMGFVLKRKHAKSVNFGWAYGMGPRSLQDNIEKAAYDSMTPAEIKEAGSSLRPELEDTRSWMNGFSKAYPGAESWKRRVIHYAKELGYVKTIGGRKRRLPDIQSGDDSLRSQSERQAVNSIIQGSVADIMQWSMLEIAKFQGDYGAKMLAQVHDELNWEVDKEHAQEFGDRASKVMTDAGNHFGLRVNLIAAPGVNDNWATAKH